MVRVSDWSVDVSVKYDSRELVSDEDRRAGEYLELMLKGRLDELIQWAAGEMESASRDLLNRVKGYVAE